MSNSFDNLSPKERVLYELLLEEKQRNKGATMPQTSRQKRDAGATGLPLSFAQQRLWFLYQLEPVNPAYNLSFARHLKGELNEAALQRSLDEIIRRHEILRTSFASIDGRPAQLLAPPRSLHIALDDLSSIPAHRQQEELRRRLNHTAQLPFRLEDWPLLRVSLFRLSATEHVLLLVMHHIISDGWSMQVLIRELGTLYAAYARGAESPLPELPVQYADYAVWQRDWLRGEVLEEQLGYWREQLSGAGEQVLELPADRARPAQLSHRGAREEMVLGAELAHGLRELSRERGVTLFMTLLAGFTGLLWRYTNAEEVVVGAPIAGRGRVELEGLIGFFTNTLALRVEVRSGEESFEELLRRVQEVCLGAYEHQEIPFEKVVDELHPQRRLNINPLFQVMFDIRSGVHESLSLPGLDLDTFEIEGATSILDMYLSMVEEKEGLRAVMQYSTDLFEAETIRRFLGHWEKMLEGIVANPRQRLSDLPLMTEAERRQLQFEWNATRDEEDDGQQVRCIHQLIEQQVERTPDAVAVIFDKEQLTYRQLDERANLLANYLRRRGVVPGARVALCLERSIEMLLSVLAVLKTGAAYLPLDPTYPMQRLAFMLSDTRPLLLLTQQSLLDKLPEHETTVVSLDAVWPEIGGEQANNFSDNFYAHSDPALPAYVIYTSGSTGQPKGVEMPHRGVVNFLQAMRREPGLSEQDVVLGLTTLSFDPSVLELYLPLMVGARIVFASREEATDGALLLRKIKEHGVTVMQATPTTWGLLLEAGWRQMPHLKALCGGEAMSRTLAEQLLQRSDSVWNMYGPTEAAIWASLSRVELNEGPVLIGRPVANMQLYVMDKRQQLAPVGVAGEIYIGGVGLAHGYVNRAELTAEKFVPNSLSDVAGERLYRTGDIGRWRAKGELEYLGRLDEQVKVRGHRIELGEIESVLAQHPAILRAAVIAAHDENQHQRLLAFVVADAEMPPSASALRQFLGQQLPDYMLPSAFIPLDELPLTTTGKIDRRHLSRMKSAQPLATTRVYVAPRTAIEEKLVEIWRKLLGVERVGVEDNFFELGGDSILSVQVVALANQAGLKLRPRQLFERQTVAELAEVAGATEAFEAEPRSDAKPHAQTLPDNLRHLEGQIEDFYSLSPLQLGFFFLKRYAPDSGEYFNQYSVRLDGVLDADAFAKAWQRVVERHQVLRTGFHWEGLEQPVQVVHREVKLPLEQLDWRELSQAEQQAQLGPYLLADRQRGMNLSEPPLMRITLIRLGVESYQFIWSHHHILLDGWSMFWLLNEAFALYESLSRGEELQPEKPRPYRDYIAWLQRQDAKQAEDFWRETLKGFSAPTPILAEQGSPDSADEPGYKEHGSKLPEETYAALKACARGHRLTLNTMLQGAWALLLSHYSGERDVVFGGVVSGRPAELSGVEKMVGLFINTLPVRAQIDPQEPVMTWLQRLQEQQSIARQYDYSSLAEVRRLSEVPQGTELFESIFAFENYPIDAALRERKGSFEISGNRLLEQMNYPLSLIVVPGQELSLQIKYHPRRFSGAAIERMLHHLVNILDAFIARPEQQLKHVSLLTQSEQEELTTAQSVARATASPVADQTSNAVSLHHLFEQQAARTPDAVALVFEGQSLSYGELNARSNQLAHHLRGLGVGLETPVGILSERGPEMIVGVLGILKAGGAYVPLDPEYPRERLAFMLADTRARIVLTQKRLAKGIGEHGVQAVALDADWEQIARESVENPSGEVNPTNAAYVIYTSGSTGKPKGVLVSHRNVLRLFESTRAWFNFDERDVWTLFHSYAFDFSVWEIWGALLHGGRLVIVPYLVSRTPETFYKLLAAERVTVLNQTPSAFNQLMAVDAAQNTPAELSLRLIIFGGEALNLQTLKGWFERHGDERPRLVNMYGITETTVHVTYRPLSADDLDNAGRSVIGSPIGDLQTYVLNRELQPVPVGIPGELYVGGAGLARGYLNRPDLSAERFMPDPFSAQPGARLYKTGDLVRYLDGRDIEYLGRIDRQVKIRGFRIELGEIEAVLSSFPGVRQAVVSMREDTPGNRRLVAYVVSEEGSAPAPDQLQNFAKKKLPAYMVPAAMVALKSLPLTSSGKLDERALPPPETQAQDAKADFVPPRNELEKQIAVIWQKVLGVEKVGVHDNFFDLGGHSILMAQVFDEVRQVVRREVAMVELFEHSTISALARHLSREKGTPAGGAAPGANAPEQGEKQREGKDRLRQQFRQRQRGRRG
jgi:amino acid adenylation domain-containing protein